jgi:hypothetical protein
MTAPRATLDEGDIPVKIDILFGRIEMKSRMRPEGRKVIGEGRSWHYDLDGNLTKDTGWQPTGVVLIWPEEPCKRWWEFWK